MVPLFGIDRFFLTLRRYAQRVLLSCKIVPTELSSLGLREGVPVCYALEYSGRGNRMALDEGLRKAGLPDAEAILKVGEIEERRSIFYLKHYHGLLPRKSLVISERLRELIRAVIDNPELDVQIVPAAVYWGRAPEQSSTIKAMLSEQWQEGGRIHRLMQVLVHGRDAMVQLAPPLSLRGIVDEGLSAEVVERKVSRILRVHFRRQRGAALGPDHSHRRNLIRRILRSDLVRDAVKKEAAAQGTSEKKVRARARKQLREISADYSYTVVRFMARILNRVINRLYDGIVLSNVENLRQLASNYEVVYVPCHRSHIDYLLLSYVIFHQGLMIPHVAAGINLNLPLIGSFLRKGGAFFLRRTFKGNRLYSSVFEAYLSAMIARGYPLEYFVEGGRSRTGRLLKPKSGMLAMTVRSFLREPGREIAFVPVYFGYEKLVEGQSFIRELRGGSKNKETVGGLLRNLPRLRDHFGKVYVNFGEPITLAPMLDHMQPNWRDKDVEHSSDSLTGVVDQLGKRILLGINEAASVSPGALLSLVLLSTPRQTMLESNLLEQLKLMKKLLDEIPYSPWVAVTDRSPEDIISDGEALDIVIREQRDLGTVVRMRTRNAVLMTYIRNNIEHLFALPSLIATGFTNRAELSEPEMIRLCGIVYPYLKDELFLRWKPSELAEQVPQVLAAMRSLGLLRHDPERGIYSRPEVGEPQAIQLNLLARTATQAIERYYMSVAVLLSHGSGVLTARQLETESRNVAQHMALLYQLDSPDYFDSTLFKNFIAAMIRVGILFEDDERRLVFDHRLESVDHDARLALSEPVRLSILQLAKQVRSAE